MFCCFDTGSVSSYPGNRRSTQYDNNVFSNESDYPMPLKERVSVTVPQGKSVGDQILVSSSSGKCVTAIIPDGVGHGDSFMVDIPMDPYDEKSPEPPLEDITPYSLTPLKKSEVEHDHHPSLNGNDVKDNFHRLNPPPYTPSQTATSARPKVMLVQVPPGLLPGTILNVQVPNENRLIPAQVPPGNVREFHVAYDYQDSASNIIVSGQPVQQSDTTSKRSNDNGHNKSKKISPVIETNPWRSNPQSRQNRHYQSSRDEHDANDVGLGFVGPVLAGAAMLGTAGYMVHHHNDAE